MISCCLTEREIWFVCGHSKITGPATKCNHDQEGVGRAQTLKVHMGFCPLCERVFSLELCHSELFLRRFWAFKRDNKYRFPMHPAAIPHELMMNSDCSDLILDADDIWAVQTDYLVFNNELAKLLRLDADGKKLPVAESISWRKCKFFMSRGRMMRNLAINCVNRPITAREIIHARAVDAREDIDLALENPYHDFDLNSVFGPDQPSQVMMPREDFHYGTPQQVTECPCPGETEPFPVFQDDPVPATSKFRRRAVQQTCEPGSNSLPESSSSNRSRSSNTFYVSGLPCDTPKNEKLPLYKKYSPAALLTQSLARLSLRMEGFDFHEGENEQEKKIRVNHLIHTPVRGMLNRVKGHDKDYDEEKAMITKACRHLPRI